LDLLTSFVLRLYRRRDGWSGENNTGRQHRLGRGVNTREPRERSRFRSSSSPLACGPSPGLATIVTLAG